MVAGAAVAGPVTLKANPVDSDGRVTLGDLFDGAGSASDVLVGTRVGPSIVFEAGQLQSLARQSGLAWANPTGLRRVVVRNATTAPTTAPPAPGSPATAASVAPVVTAGLQPGRATFADRVITRNDMVEVAYVVGGVRVTVTGRAEGNAAAGQPLVVRNLQSGRSIDAVATGPGQALAGPAAQQARATQQLAAR
jgi:flagella basal body P-ring formation protein FlgA